MNQEITVLVTAAGTATSVNIVKYLSKIARIRIVTTDTNSVELVPAAIRWETTHYQVPFASSGEKFVSRLVEICHEERVDFLYPVHDQEIAVVLESRELFPSRTILPPLTLDTVRACNDKWLNYSICRSSGLPVPETWLGSSLAPDISWDSRQRVRKPRNGVGSAGVRKVPSFQDLKDDDLGDDVIYQDFCSGAEYTVDVLSLPGRLYAIGRQRVETKMGLCTKARVSVEPRFTDLAVRIAGQFSLSGLFCFQVMEADRGSLEIIDINPRCGGGTALTAAAGFPIYEAFFSNMLQLADAGSYQKLCDERVDSGGEAVVCRYYEEVVTQFHGKD